jgi:hypothetical protein
VAGFASDYPNAGVPNFGVNYNTTFGTGFSVGENPAYYPGYENKIIDGQRNISNHLVEVRKNYGPEWHAANGGGTSWYSIYNWPALGSSARTMDALYAGNYLEAGIQFATCAAEVFTFGYSSQITTGVRTTVGNLKVPVYRVYGDGATMYGKSYSLINPEYVPYYRNFAGLPDVNSGQYLLKGSIPLRDINVGRWFAAPFPGNTGGLPFELYQNYNQLINPVNVLIKKPF